VRRVEFFADGLKIGETSMDFILPPPPGQSQSFSFTWREPAPGPHVLTARAIDDDNASATSQGVQIRVGASNAPAVISVYAPDSYAVEPSASATPVLDTATFRITRSGSTNVPLTVVYRLYGTAQNGVDYQSINAWVIIPRRPALRHCHGEPVGRQPHRRHRKRRPRNHTAAAHRVGSLADVHPWDPSATPQR
jgi:hypothetical protein